VTCIVLLIDASVAGGEECARDLAASEFLLRPLWAEAPAEIDF
jgi:hypothetical protein